MDILWNQFHFLRPWAFLFIFLLVFIIYLINKAAKIGKSWQKICTPELLAYLQVGTSPKRSYSPVWLIGLAACLAMTALAGPVWQQQPQAVYREDSALLIALDLSRSMDAQDVNPSRLVRAKQKLRDILALRKEGQTALLVFAATAYAVTPLTEDTQTIAAQLEGLSTDIMPKQGGNLDAAIKQAQALFQQASVRHGQLLFLTDSSNVSKPIVDAFKKAGHQLNVIAIGSLQGAPIPKQAGGFLNDSQGNIVIASLNKTALQDLATWGDGVYHDISLDNSDIAPVLARLTPSVLEKMQTHDSQQQESVRYDIWQEEGYWLLLCLIPLVLLGFRRGLLLVVLCVSLHLEPVEVSAAEMDMQQLWHGMWQTHNKQAEALMADKKYKQASESFEDSTWKMAAHYKDKNYAAAIHDFDAIAQPSVEDLYNKANALAQLGKLDAAIATYAEVLKQQPQHQDAKANKALLEKILQQQKHKQDQSEQGKDKHGKDKQHKKQASKDGQSKEASGDKDQANKPQAKSKQQNKPDKQGKTKPAKQSKDSEASKKSKPTNKRAAKPDQANPNKVKPNKAKQAEEKTKTRVQKQHQLSEDELKKLEAKQEFEQTLRRVPDDPGGLLRRKFLYQYKQQDHGAVLQGDKQW